MHSGTRVRIMMRKMTIKEKIGARMFWTPIFFL